MQVRAALPARISFRHFAHVTFPPVSRMTGMNELTVSSLPLERDSSRLESPFRTDLLNPAQALTAKYRENPSSYSPDELRKNLASWGPVLFYHLDAEVESLKPDVLRRCAFLLSLCAPVDSAVSYGRGADQLLMIWSRLDP